MTETYTPAVRVVVAASLLFAIALMTFVTVSIARASGTALSLSCGAFREACGDDVAMALGAHAATRAMAGRRDNACLIVVPGPACATAATQTYNLTFGCAAPA